MEPVGNDASVIAPRSDKETYYKLHLNEDEYRQMLRLEQEAALMRRSRSLKTVGAKQMLAGTKQQLCCDCGTSAGQSSPN
jgi:hypothetical protein